MGKVSFCEEWATRCAGTVQIKVPNNVTVFRRVGHGTVSTTRSTELRTRQALIMTRADPSHELHRSAASCSKGKCGTSHVSTQTSMLDTLPFGRRSLRRCCLHRLRPAYSLEVRVCEINDLRGLGSSEIKNRDHTSTMSTAHAMCLPTAKRGLGVWTAFGSEVYDWSFGFRHNHSRRAG